MKNIFILSENKVFKKDLSDILIKEAGKENLYYLTASSRSNAIAELAHKEFDVIIIDCTLVKNDLQLILKYLSTNNYYFCHIYFLSDDFSVFTEILANINFPHIHLISLPIEITDLSPKIITSLYPKDTGIVDKNIKINLDFLKVFIDGTKKVFKDFCTLNQTQHQKPFLKNIQNATNYALTGKIVLKSEKFEGIFSLGFTEEIYVKLINKVLLLEAKTIEEDYQDFAAEIVNMIYGQAKLTLNESGHNFLKVLPTFETNTKYTPNKNNIVVVPIETELGLINIEIEVIRIEGLKL